MEKFCSWRLSRILEPSAWKRQPFFLFLLVLCLIFITSTYKEEWPLLVIYGILAMVIICFILEIVLGADKSYRLKLLTQVCDIYVYKNNFGADVIIIQNGKETHVKTRLGEEGYRFYRSCSFLYYSVDEDCWFYLSPTSDEPQRLGKKVYYGVGDSVFLKGINADGTVNLCALHDCGIININANRFIVDEAYVPPKAEKNMKYLDGSPVKKLPESYLIVEKDGGYDVYGLSNTWTEKPQCVKICVPAIIYADINERVVLIKKRQPIRTVMSQSSRDKVGK